LGKSGSLPAWEGKEKSRSRKREVPEGTDPYVAENVKRLSKRTCEICRERNERRKFNRRGGLYRGVPGKRAQRAGRSMGRAFLRL